MNIEHGQDEITIDAPSRAVFSLLQDSTLLPRWMPVVKATTGQHQVLGAIRECEVNISGRRGRMREECSECIPYRRIAWRVLSETVGFDVMIRDFQFSFELIESGPRDTRVIHRSSYAPKHAFGLLLLRLVGRRKFHQVRVRALLNLKQLSEAGQIASMARLRGAATATAMSSNNE